MMRSLEISTSGAGLHDITAAVNAIVRDSGVHEGLCHVFLQHTSAGLTIQENADPAVRRDLVNWLSRLVAENDPLYTHTTEGPDDMPAHIKTVLTSVSLTLPVQDGRLALGTWQGLYLWEFRRRSHSRRLIITVTAL